MYEYGRRVCHLETKYISLMLLSIGATLPSTVFWSCIGHLEEATSTYSLQKLGQSWASSKRNWALSYVHFRYEVVPMNWGKFWCCQIFPSFPLPFSFSILHFNYKNCFLSKTVLSLSLHTQSGWATYRSDTHRCYCCADKQTQPKECWIWTTVLARSLLRPWKNHRWGWE